MVLRRVWPWRGTLKNVIWYFELGDVAFGRWRCGTLKRVLWYFEEGVAL